MIKLTIKNLSRDQADCFLLVFEKDDNRITMLIDGNREGKPSVDRIQKELSSYDSLDYILVTHIDSDHLGGVLKLLESKVEKEKLEHTRIIYNYVTEVNVSFNQARRFEKIIKGREIIKSYNGGIDADDFLCFMSRGERAICQDIGSKHKIFFTFLGPDMEEANKVWSSYENGARERGTLINQYSIVFMIELGPYKFIFTGDAYWHEVQQRVDGLLKADDTIHMIKIPHHGAKDYNVGMAEYIKVHNGEKVLVTGKQTWNHDKPDKEMIKDLAAAGNTNGLVVYSTVNLDPYFQTVTEDIIYEVQGEEDSEK